MRVQKYLAHSYQLPCVAVRLSATTCMQGDLAVKGKLKVEGKLCVFGSKNIQPDGH
jgi:hypothetical protein